MSRLLITGACGFIGSNLVKRCLADGHKVIGVDNLSNGHLEFLPRHIVGNDKFELLCHDFTDGKVLDVIKMHQADVVIHLAAIPRVSYSVEHPIETNDTNVSKTLKLMDACRGNVKRFVFASSSSVYGNINVLSLPACEDYAKRPSSPYALQKSIIEEYLKLYYELYGLDSACLRFFNVFGDNALGVGAYATAIASWLTAIKRGLPMRSDGDGKQSRDLCHVDNVTDACVRAATHIDELKADRFNVACGEATTNNAILEYLLKKYPGSSYVSGAFRTGDVMHTLADVRKAKIFLGYEPIVRVWDGVARTCDWYDNNWSWAQHLTLRT